MDRQRAIRTGELAATRATLKMLVYELGIVKTGRVLFYIIQSKLSGEPFAVLGPALDERDQLSRKQCGDLILLDRAIRQVDSQETAMRICRASVHAGAIPFLEQMIPNQKPEEFQHAASSLTSLFFNAEGTAMLQHDGSFSFDVHRCRFVELLAKTRALHLAPLFCEADSVFFESNRRPIQLKRSQTIATGAQHCDFRFYLK